jgi:ribosomal protein L11 methyltransferase
VPATWLRVGVRSPSEELAGLLAEGLLACGGSAIEERDGRLVTYIAADAGSDAGARVHEVLSAVLGGQAPDLELEYVPEQDWLALWRSGLGPRRLGERIVVAPTWSEVELQPHELLVRIDPQMAFGTGEHASTRGVLRLMQRAVEPGTRLLDVGSGSAILAIAAVRLGAAEVIAAEADAEAMSNATENILNNGVEHAVRPVCELVDDAFLTRRGTAAFDGILANVLSGVLRPLLPAFHASLAPGGWAILAGILTEEASFMKEAAGAAGFRLEAEDVEEQWWSVLLRRPSS